ncbi:DNase I-like protein [Phlegmacium glaucopus]|nr:DNase I-like protein [Phlegmacium glaucopus]
MAWESLTGQRFIGTSLSVNYLQSKADDELNLPKRGAQSDNENYNTTEHISITVCRGMESSDIDSDSLQASLYPSVLVPGQLPIPRWDPASCILIFFRSEPTRQTTPATSPRASKLLNNASPSSSLASSPLLRPVPVPLIAKADPREQPQPRNWNIPVSTSPARSPSPFLLSQASTTSAQNRYTRTPPVSPIRIASPRKPFSTSSGTIPGPPRPTTSGISQLLDTEKSLSADNPPTSSSTSPPIPARQASFTFVPPIPARRQPNNNNVNNIIAYSIDPSQNPTLAHSARSTIPPPRPPPRNHPPISAGRVEAALISPNPNVFASPPPLPVRRGVNVSPEELPFGSMPSLPSRSQLVLPSTGDSERKPLGASKLPPPPTRTIALGDKLPPPRRPTTPSSDEESGEEEEARANAVDLMPDSSTSSRRPPQLAFHDGFSESRIHVHPQTGCVALSGTYVVVGHGHHIKIFDLAKSEVPLLNLDTKDIGAKDSKVTSMEFRPTASHADRGYLFWVGTKEGHIFELDIRTGIIRGIKHAAHLHHIVHIFRHSRSMVTLDESGKALIFSPDVSNQEDISLALTVPRVVRTTEKQDFVKMLDGKLWTSARAEHHGHLTQKLPIIRVFDLFNPASTGRSLLPTEHVGPVTSATILPSQPGMVYVGHEEGFISMWELDTEDGYPRCVEIMKVAVSDVLSLEGVSNRLWAGSRNGMIAAYDVSQKPWLVTNCWNAHPWGASNEYWEGRAVETLGWASGMGLGRKSETSFSSFLDLTVMVVSWNCDSARPDSLNGDPQNYNLLNDALHSVDSPPDIIVFGFQEVIDLESRKMVAKNVFLGGKKKTDDGLSEKVTGAYKRWHDRLVLAVRAAMPKDVAYCVAHTESLIGLFSCIFVKNTERPLFDDVSATTIKRGMGGRYGNKGGIVARFLVGDSSICFINCHVAAGQNAVRHRNADVAGMLEEKAVFSPTDHSMAYIRGGGGTMVLDHEFVFLNGDMNYRIDHRRDAIIAAIRAGDLASLLPHDQLLREIKRSPHTYKYDPRSDEYDSSLKHRAPAWCDRILWRSRVANRVQQLHYKRYEANVSDHRPISAAFSVTVKSFDYEARENSKALLQAQWLEEQERLLVAAREFYGSQALI